MSKETYHVNDKAPKTTWKMFIAAVLCCLAIVLLLLSLRFFASDNHVKEYDSICEFITFGPVLQLNLKGSKQWMKIEDDVRDLCNIGSDVQIYSIGNLPVPVPVLDIELVVADDNETSEVPTDDNEETNGSTEPVPSILISGQELSNSLLMSVELQFGDELWAIVWEKTIDTKMWQIEARNIDAINSQPLILLYEMVQRALLQLLFAIIIDECYQASNFQTQINCTNINFIPPMRSDIVKPLVKSFIANETECVQSEFFVEDFDRVEMSENFQEIVMKRADSSNIINFEVKLCH